MRVTRYRVVDEKGHELAVLGYTRTRNLLREDEGYFCGLPYYRLENDEPVYRHGSAAFKTRRGDLLQILPKDSPNHGQ